MTPVSFFLDNIWGFPGLFMLAISIVSIVSVVLYSKTPSNVYLLVFLFCIILSTFILGEIIYQISYLYPDDVDKSIKCIMQYIGYVFGFHFILIGPSFICPNEWKKAIAQLMGNNVEDLKKE